MKEDLSYFDSNPPEIDSDEQREFELSQLQALAKICGDYEWQYNQEGIPNDDGQTHSGPTAQEIAKIPGFENAVKPDENGTLTVDINYLALATIGALAALSRLVLKEKYLDL